MPEHGDAQPIREQTPSSEFSELYQRQRERWKDALGVELDIPPVPEYVTPAVKENLKALGCELTYMPPLDLKSRDHLQSVGVENYLKELAERYPKWRSLESLSPSEMKDQTVPHNLDAWFWEAVKNGNIDFPKLPGQWMAIETVARPSWSNPVIHEPERTTSSGTRFPAIYGYPVTPLAELLRLAGNRWRRNWYEIEEQIEKHKGAVLQEAGLARTPADVRLPEAHEWNLAENHFGWEKVDSSELTNTEFRGERLSRPKSFRVRVGNNEIIHSTVLPSQGYANYIAPDNPIGGVGWRVAIILPEKP